MAAPPRDLGAPAAEDIVLTVLALGTSSRHALGPRARVTIGRAADNDVRIDDASVSRHHAVLHVGASLEIEDLGSANGTRIIRANREADATTWSGETRVVPGRRVRVSPGDGVNVGATLVIVGGDGAPPPAASTTCDGAVLASAKTKELFALAARVAASPLNVLVVGETGTGKELVAEQIHRASPRARGPFVRINCAALPEHLIEGELFGHERGAFTGATSSTPGLVETAEGGTLFLDEVGELPSSAQAKLLRVLEQREVMRIGAREPRKVDVRFVAATHQDLAARAAEGTYRKDLYFRLNGFRLAIPPLRERPEDVVALAKHFVALDAAALGRSAPTLSTDAVARLLSHAWPGNARELKNVIARALVLCPGAVVEPDHLVLDSLDAGEPRSPAPPAAPSERESAQRQSAASEGSEDDTLGASIEALERRRIEEALAKCGGSQTRAAELLGISRRTLVYRLGKYGITRPRTPRGQ